jgi:hypothetical protein
MWSPSTAGVYDSDRVMFLRACLGQLQRATAEGVPVDGDGTPPGRDGEGPRINDWHRTPCIQRRSPKSEAE